MEAEVWGEWAGGVLRFELFLDFWGFILVSLVLFCFVFVRNLTVGVKARARRGGWPH